MPPQNLPTEHVVEPILPHMTVANPQPEEVPASTSEKTKKIGTLVLIGIALIAAMAVTVIAVPRGVRYLSSISFSSLFIPQEKIVVTPQKSKVVSGERIAITWNGPVRTQGVYSVTYPCKQDISATFHSGELMTCNAPFYFASADNSIAFSFNTLRDRDTDVPLYINYKDTEGNTSIVGDTIITVLAVGSAAVPNNVPTIIATSTTPVVTTPATTTKPVVTKPADPKPAPKPAPTPSYPVASYTDLVVKITDLGSLTPSNTFIPGLTVAPGNRHAVRFEVTNTGTKASGIWSLKGLLPSPTTPVYSSNFQPSLARGDRVIMTLGFDVNTSGGRVTISINDDRVVVESNYQNNIFTYTVTGTGTIQTTPANTTGNTVGGTNKDLSVRMVATGYIVNGQFFAAQSISTSQRPAFRFIVTNNGTTASGAWSYKADLPSRTDTTYTSGTLDSLNAGASAEFTIGFDNIYRIGDNTITVTVDPANSVQETNEFNNAVSGIIRAY